MWKKKKQIQFSEIEFKSNYLIANPINKFIIMIATRRRKSINAIWMVGVPFSTPSGMNTSPKLNSPTIIAKVHINAVKGSPKCS